jgi:hypothetical protein
MASYFCRSVQLKIFPTKVGNWMERFSRNGIERTLLLRELLHAPDIALGKRRSP